MMKFLIMMSFMFLFIFSNKMIMFYYNLCFLMSFMVLLNYLNNSVWIMTSGYTGVDYYSFILIMMTFWVVGLMYMSLEGDHFFKSLMFLILLLVLIIFFSMKNIILFYLFFELSLVPTFMLIVYWGYNPERLSAAYYMLMYTLLISLPLLVWIIYMYQVWGSFDMVLLALNVGFMNMSVWMFMVIVGAFLIKMPVYLFHIWLPKAHVEAPVYGSMILAAVLLKLGSYGLLRFLMIFLSSAKFSTFMVSIGIVGSLIVSLLCLVQVDMKSLVAYSSVVHMNMMLCGAMSMMSIGFVSAYIIMISHGLCSSGMFYMVNTYYYRSSSRLLLMNKGLINIIPSYSIWWFLLCSSNFSFPLTMGFFGEVCLLGVMVGWELMLVGYLILVSFFSSAYSLYLYSYIQHGELGLMKNVLGGACKELLVMILHFFPLMILIVDLIMF